MIRQSVILQYCPAHYSEREINDFDLLLFKYDKNNNWDWRFNNHQLEIPVLHSVGIIFKFKNKCSFKDAVNLYQNCLISKCLILFQHTKPFPVQWQECSETDI